MVAFRDLPQWATATLRAPIWVLAVMVSGIVAIAGTYGYSSWRKTSYTLTRDALHYSTGILFHRRRRFELAHMQEVDIRRPWWGRPISACTLRLSVSGQSSELAYLGTRQAALLRDALLADMTRDTRTHELRTPPAPRHELIAVSARRLAAATALDAGLMGRAAVTLATGLVPYLASTDPLALVSLVGAVGPAWRMTARRLILWHGWRVTAESGGYRTEFGLFSTQRHTLRHQRTQAVILEQPILWRRKRWVRIHLATAGYHRPQLLTPVATIEEAHRLLESLYGHEAVSALHASGPAPRRARWATPLNRGLSFHSSEHYLCARKGLIFKSTIHLCPKSKVQGAAVIQGPWQRHLRLATVEVKLAGGPNLTARHRDSAQAAQIVAETRHASLAVS
jgi:putative membrane protein